MNRNKEKGKAFERRIANHLTDIFGVKFCRTPNSGAHTGGSNMNNDYTDNQRLLLDGDIIVPENLKNFVFECKTKKVFSFSQLYRTSKVLEDWILQALHPNKIWFLIFKINNQGEYVVFDEKHSTHIFRMSTFHIYKLRYIIAPLDGFFENNREDIIELNNDYNDATRLLAGNDS
jgi:hypothetical protein